ncbi:hypothetical protein [uncultured Dialister sp.]|uniref:hypothetical protein n=1 Tax=uncultured Dialister sp. TaxID=278064 RepID=UPI0025E27297|nr:hypothetical protein [uncultured Dialister sp.]
MILQVSPRLRRVPRLRRGIIILYIYLPALPEGTPLWCAQWGSACDIKEAMLWQFTNSLPLEDQLVDGDIWK